MSINTKENGSYGYVCLYKGKRCEVYAATQYEAKMLAAIHWKVPSNKYWKVTAYLAEKDGKDVVQPNDT